MMENFAFSCRAKTGFGTNALDHICFDLSCMDAKKPFVITDKTARDADLDKILAKAFNDSNMTIGIAEPLNHDRTSLENMYRAYTDKGFDSIIALGTGQIVNFAKILNLAVCLGPNALRQAAPAPPQPVKTQQINTQQGLLPILEPLYPLVYIPTGPGNCSETSIQAVFESSSFSSRFFMPDLVVVTQEMMLEPCLKDLVNSGLTTLSVCCEAYALSANPPARSYAAVGICLVMEIFQDLVRYSLEAGRQNHKKPLSKKQSANLAKLAHASAIAGYILANCPDLKSVRSGLHSFKQYRSRLSNHSAGQCMAMALPLVLASSDRNNPWLGRLLLPLTDPDTFSCVPHPDRAGQAIGIIKNIMNQLFKISCGQIPRNFKDAGLNEHDIAQILASARNTASEQNRGVSHEYA